MTDRRLAVRRPGALPGEAALVFACAALAVAGCSSALPVGPAPAVAPAPSRLASAIVMDYLPAAEATELEAVTTKLAGTQDQLAIIIGGLTWGMPITLRPLTRGEFSISAESKNQALQIQRLLH